MTLWFDNDMGGSCSLYTDVTLFAGSIDEMYVLKVMGSTVVAVHGVYCLQLFIDYLKKDNC